MKPVVEERVQDYPGGIDNPVYRFAFRTWVFFFMGLICVGLLNYLFTVLR